MIHVKVHLRGLKRIIAQPFPLRRLQRELFLGEETRVDAGAPSALANTLQVVTKTPGDHLDPDHVQIPLEALGPNPIEFCGVVPELGAHRPSHAALGEKRPRLNRVVGVSPQVGVMFGNAFRDDAFRMGFITLGDLHAAVTIDGMIDGSPHQHVVERGNLDVECEVVGGESRLRFDEVFPSGIGLESAKTGKRQ